MMNDPEIAAQKVTLEDMLSEAKREVSLRKVVYPTQIANGKLKEQWAQIHLKRMEAIVTFFEWATQPGRRAAMVEGNQLLEALRLIVQRREEGADPSAAIEAAKVFLINPVSK